MTLLLKLSPAEERELAASAERAGVSVEEYALNRILPSRSEPTTAPHPRIGAERRAQLENEAARAFTASGVTEEEVDEYGVELIKKVRAEMRAEDERK